MKSKDLGRNGSPFEILITSHPYYIDPAEQKSLLTSLAEKERAIEKISAAFNISFIKWANRLKM